MRQFFLRGRFLENLAFVVIDKHQIHVRVVIEFLPTELAETEHANGGRLPAAVGILMERPAKPPGELQADNLENRLQANIGDIGKFAGDFHDVAQAGQIARGNPKQFTLLEPAHFGQGGGVILRFQRRAKQPSQFLLKTLRAARKFKAFGVEQRQPVGMRQQQVAKGLRTAGQRNECVYGISGEFFQLRPRARRNERIKQTPGALRVGGGFQRPGPKRVFHNRTCQSSAG